MPRNTPGALSDVYTESVAAPVAHAAGIRTPALVVWDESMTILDVPYTVYQRVHADTAGLVDRDLRRAWREVGRELALLHARVTECPDPLGRLDDAGRTFGTGWLHEMERDGWIAAETVRIAERWFARLDPAVTAAQDLARFTHNDLHPLNVMVDHDCLAAIIDWGDAAWGDPAGELYGVPMHTVPYVLLGYRDVMPMDQDETVEARVLWDKLWSALGRLGSPPPHPGRIEPDARPGTRIVRLLDFLASDEGRDWARLIA